MKNSILFAIFTWAIFPPLALASDASLETSDLASLKKVVHDVNQSQLEERYHAYAAQMKAYLVALPSYKNIWLNVNSMDLSKIPPGLEFSPLAMAKKADLDIMQEVCKTRIARHNLVGVTTPEAVKQIDKNHQWVLPTEVSQIKPPPGITKASDLK